MNFNIKKVTNQILSQFNVFKEASSSSSQITNANLKNYIIKHVGWDSESDDFSPPENDLAEVKSAIETDSYIKVALDKMYQLIFKAGYKITSNNEAAVEYLQQRIKLMEFGTGIPFDIMLQEIARDMIYYSNSFWVKSRVDKIQGGFQVKSILSKKPVGGYFRADPTIMEIKRDSSGTITQYKIAGTEEQTFNAEDVVHFYADRDASNNFGTPRVISALEDVKILRKIEGSTLSLIYRFAIPLYQMKIGLPEQNMMATNQEISEAQDQINKMPMDGVIVTNERTQFIAVGADGKAIDLSVYLNYYEKRVFTALNTSEAMMGRGGSKQDADSMEGIMHDTVKYFQNMISIFIETGIFNELLLEGGYNPIMNMDDIVKFEFNEINLDTKVKMENHELVKFQSNGITFEEWRRAIGKKADGIDESRLYSNMITTANAIEVINAKVSAEGGSTNGNIKNGKIASSNPSSAAKSVNTPSNQNGSSSAKVKEEFAPRTLRTILQEGSTSENIKQYRKKYTDMYKLYKKIGNDIAKKGKFSAKDLESYTNQMNTLVEKMIRDYSLKGYKKSQLSDERLDFNKNYVSKVILRLGEKTISNLFKDIADRVNDKKNQKYSIPTCFGFMEYRLRFACEYLSAKAYWYSNIIGYKLQGIKSLELDLSNGHKDNKSTISTDKFTIDQIPPFSPYCSCEVKKPEKV